MTESLRSLFSRIFRVGTAAVEDGPEPVSFPPPYQRMVAINSDVEYTSWAAQLALLRQFDELELETAFSYWFYNDPATTWRLFENDGSLSRNAPAAFALARAGFLDTIHSFGGKLNGEGCQFDRAAIARGYEILREYGIQSEICSNHGTVKDIQNIGGAWCESHGALNYQKGDVPGTECYHLDLTIAHGVRFFWVDIDRQRTVNSFQATANDAVDSLFTIQDCRDGNRILRFKRTDTGVDPVNREFHHQIANVLEAPAGGYSVIYTHLGVHRDSAGKPFAVQEPVLEPDALTALADLRDAASKGDVLVTTTTRLLRHALMMMVRPWRTSVSGNVVNVEFDHTREFDGLNLVFDWKDLDGFTIPLKKNQSAVAHLNGDERPLESFESGGSLYAGLVWQPLDLSAALEEARCAS